MEWSLASSTTEKGVVGLGGASDPGNLGQEDLCRVEGTWVIAWGLVTVQELVCRICAKIGG